MSALPPWINDLSKELIAVRRESMSVSERAFFDFMVLLELLRRGLAPEQFALELRIKAGEYAHREPYLASMMKVIADTLPAQNVVPLPARPPNPGAKP